MTLACFDGDAIISADGLYRYALYRSWVPGKSTVCWIMLNPSTADATHDDPTIRRCIRFSQSWGFERLAVVNLFAIRATDSRTIRHVGQRVAVGPENDRYILEHAQQAELIVAAWGAAGGAYSRDRAVRELLRPFAPRVRHIGLTVNGGHPRHPLYVRRDSPPVPWDAMCWVLA